MHKKGFLLILKLAHLRSICIHLVDFNSTEDVFEHRCKREMAKAHGSWGFTLGCSPLYEQS